MSKKNLHTEFQEAVVFVNKYEFPIPADILLKLYAYYKVANKNYNNPGSKTPLINAFKANALIQAQNINMEDAMKEYIKLVDKELKS
ncbi:acyl-CoA-binding protein [Maribacter algicola]|uniref:Acyl-CoA-binding protein n=1 Tax=Maribacter algicola TaxID=2498892 RepID=A0A3R8Q1A8_9FLAO|nr:acyl-CoA-binding protein [Maribacter algicola]RRQ47753.1 acyl-CoA-binding protein [Maribacter algicola]